MSRITTKDVYGPGTYTDVNFIPLREDCQRLLQYFADVTPNFTRDHALLDTVDFHGRDLPILPGPLKSQALSAVLQALIGIVGKEISEIKGVQTGRISIDIDKSGLYVATPALVVVDGKGMAEVQKDRTLFKVGTDVDHGVINKNGLHVRSWAIYPTKDPKVYYQLLGNLHIPEFLKVFGIDSETPVSSRQEAYEMIKAHNQVFSC